MEQWKFISQYDLIQNSLSIAFMLQKIKDERNKRVYSKSLLRFLANAKSKQTTTNSNNKQSACVFVLIWT